MIKLEYQYFEGCPNHHKLEQNLKIAMQGIESLVELRYVLVEDEEAAQKTSFRGSPTLLIDGMDIEDVPAPAKPSLSCRFYPNGVPSAEFIRKIIESKID